MMGFMAMRRFRMIHKREERGRFVFMLVTLQTALSKKYALGGPVFRNPARFIILLMLLSTYLWLKCE